MASFFCRASCAPFGLHFYVCYAIVKKKAQYHAIAASCAMACTTTCLAQLFATTQQLNMTVYIRIR